MSQDNKKSKSISRRDFISRAAAAATSAAASASFLSATRVFGDEAGKKNEIVTAKIHPAIGVARVGNSQAEEDFYIGPEVVEPSATKEIRDFEGALLRQAARFRIYGYDAKGRVVRELTADEADIEWTVHVANKKSAWYRFLVALDLPESKSVPAQRRNAKVKGSDRKTLMIDPGPKSIAGSSQAGREYHLEGGEFMGEPVSLGELRTDGKGRLLFLSGLGKSGSPDRKKVYEDQDPDSFNNADGWYDDISDGPVRAAVTIKGRPIPVESAWVFVGPPNYAPDLISWRTMYELLVDTYVGAGMMPVPEKTSFQNDVLPLLKRLTGLQWVNYGLAKVFGKGAEFDFDNPELLKKLSTPGASALRKKIYACFRTNEADTQMKAKTKDLWPQQYGDAYGSLDESKHNTFILSGLRELHLKRWLDGDFVNDYGVAAPKPIRRLSDLPVSDQPAMLDQAALHFCLADAFHPGCEVTWPMRHASLYRAPFRIKERSPDAPEPDYGDMLTHEKVMSPTGPLYSQGPGDLTKWMAIPWQGDTVFCRSGYEPEFDPYLLTFWPARVPNHVLTEEDYALVMNKSLPRKERLAAFNRRKSWFRGLKGPAPNQIVQAVNRFHELGVIVARPGYKNDQDFPPVIFVENLSPDSKEMPTPYGGRSRPGRPGRRRGRPGSTRGGTRTMPESGPTTSNTPIEQAGWESAEQLEEFRNIRIRRKPK